MKALEELHVRELSVVDRGANKKKRFPIFKQETSMDKEKMDAILKAVLETELDSEAPLDELIVKMEISEKGANAAKAALRILSGFKDEMPTDFLAKLGAMAGMPAAKAAKADDEEEDDDKKPAFLKGKKTVKKNEDGEEEEPVSKDTDALPEDVQKQFDEIQKAADEKINALTERNEKIEKQLQAETDARQLAEWTEKARADLSHFPGKSIDEMGVMLKSLADLDPEMAKSQFESMKSASDAMKESEILKSAGGVGVHEAAGSSWDKIEKLADGLVEKSADIELTKEEAIAKVLESPRGKDLYNKYNEEAAAAARR